MHERINPRDEAAVIWLQRALNRLLPAWPRSFVIGEYDELTLKAIQAYQHKHELPVTDLAMLRGRVLDDALLQHIKSQLQARNLTIS